MKKFFLFFILVCLTSGIYSQVLFTYGNNTVSKDEFLRAYNKNKTTVTDKSAALREYLDLYIKFKLKVKAAQDMRIDTIASLANDLQNFRTQIEEGYLNDESQVNALTQEALNRSQKDVHVVYYFFPVTNQADTLNSYNTAKGYYVFFTGQSGELKTAYKIEDKTDIGFITAFSLPYDFENIIYSLKPGEVNKPFRTKNGYYIFKNIEERKAAGKMKAAQILIAVPENAQDADRANAKKIADSVYKELQQGSDFGEMAKKVSNDKMTYESGGIMPEFGVGKYEPAFEKEVFNLKKDGDFTSPFQTKFGYHIVKRISKTDIPQDNRNDIYMYALKQQVLQDNRINSAKEKFLNDILKKLNYKKNPVIKEADIWRVTDSFMIADKKLSSSNLNDNTVLFSLNNQQQKLSDWFNYLKNVKASGAYKGEGANDLMKKYVSQTALDIYKKRLEYFNPDFKYQLQEFKDGNMLFEVMERNVWTKASNDSTGLKNYYNLHQGKYTWNESADAILISCSNERVATDAVEQLKKGKTWKQLAEENLSQIQADSGRYELTQIPAKPNTQFIEGMVTEPLINTSDGTATMAKIIKIYPANQQRSFEEARGLVINDYQNYLEEKWIEQLKKKYPVKINEKVFKSLF